MTGGNFWSRLFGNGASQPSAPREQPAPQFNFDDPRIPNVARERVAAIRGIVAELEQRAISQASAQELAELRQISELYLPKLLQSYIDIPPDHRAEIFRQTGRSASYALGDRLDKMIARLREISAMLAQDNLDAFRENIRFIDMRFGKSPFDL
jgi:hypothetical protein